MLFEKAILRLNFATINRQRGICTTSASFIRYVTDFRNKPKTLPVTEARKGEPMYFENEGLKLHPAPGYIDRLGEIWFDKMSSQHDLKYKSADNLLAKDCTKTENYLPKVDETKPRLEYEDVKALKTAPESVQKIFSIKYGDRLDLVAKWQRLVVDQVRHHSLDDQSLEASIARLTVGIRQLTHLLHMGVGKPKFHRRPISKMLDARKELLARLREQDAASFEAVLKELKIAYVVPPVAEDTPDERRKAWIRHIVDRKTERIKEERLEKLRLELVEKRKAFKAERDEKLAELDEEEERLRNEIQELDRQDDEFGVLDLRPVGVYSGRTIDCISENFYNEWMYRPPPHRKPVIMSDQLKKRFR